MAFIETKENDKIEVVNRWNVQVRTATVVKKDGVEIARSYDRHSISPGLLKGGTGSDKDDLVPTDLSKEDADVQAIANAAWTTQVKADYKANLIANKPS